MFDDRMQCNKFVQTLHEYFNMEGKSTIADLLIPARVHIDQTNYDNWNGGIFIYTMYIDVSISDYKTLKEQLSDFEEMILNIASGFLRKLENESLEKVVISPEFKLSLNFERLSGFCSRSEFVGLINTMQDQLIKVSTGDLMIKVIDDQYRSEHKQLLVWCSKLGIDNPIPFASLWKWKEYWENNQLATYQSRRVYISDLLNPINDMLSSSEEANPIFTEPSGWDRVDRIIKQMEKQLADAVNVEEFQKVGFLGTQVLISIAQEVYDPIMLPPDAEVIPSETDAKRMLDAFINFNLHGRSNENLRRFAKASIDVANDVKHNRTATRRDAEICILSVTATLKLVLILGTEEDEVVVF